MTHDPHKRDPRERPVPPWARRRREPHGWPHHPPDPPRRGGGPRTRGPWEFQDPRYREWRRGRRIFLRFALVFGIMIVLAAGGMGALAYVLTHAFGGDGHIAVRVWMGGCLLVVGLPLLALGVGGYAFRRIATPLAALMSAADAVAQGDLSVRVPSRGPGEFTQFAAAFNRMVTELERADQHRRNMTADIAHELRTPLHIIQGNLEGVLDGVYEPTPDHLNATLEETRTLSRLVEELRTLSLAEAGQLSMTHEAVDLTDVVADVVTSFSGQAEQQGILLAADLPAAPLVIGGDAGRLDQVLSNLVANALRHTPQGGRITLGANRTFSPDTESDSVRLTVQDTGEGIAADDLPYIFDRFWRGDPARTRLVGTGSGLGLAIVRQLVQAHGGYIEAESVVGQGTTFTITLPQGEVFEA